MPDEVLPFDELNAVSMLEYAAKCDGDEDHKTLFFIIVLRA